jgi:glycosyltransferase involved in cell wall biosynthesis
LPNFWNKIINSMDKVVAYTNYGKEAVLKSFPHLEKDLEVIYHGVDEKTFHLLPKEKTTSFRNRFNLAERFIFLVVARNQGRKNWAELFKAWKIVQEKGLCPGAVLWPHTYFYDPAGHNIDDLLETLDLANSKSIVFFSQIGRGNSFLKMCKVEELNILYNMADALISVGGEGFGLPVIEAMATKTPCGVLNESATKELGGEGRSFLIESSYYLLGRYLTERPIPSPENIAKVMQQIYQDAEKRKEAAEKGYSFAMENTWTKIGEKWKRYFDCLESPTKYPMVLEEVTA